MRELVVFPRDGWWVSEFVGDESVFELLGSTVVPTSFRVSVPVGVVLRELGARNPGFSVDWFDSELSWLDCVAAGSPASAAMAGVEVTR